MKKQMKIRVQVPGFFTRKYKTFDNVEKVTVTDAGALFIGHWSGFFVILSANAWKNVVLEETYETVGSAADSYRLSTTRYDEAA